MLTPILVVKDPALIKQICIKDFDVFPEHRSLSGNESIEPLWDRNLLAANGTALQFKKRTKSYSSRI